MKLIPASSAAWMMRIDSSWSGFPRRRTSSRRGRTGSRRPPYVRARDGSSAVQLPTSLREYSAAPEYGHGVSTCTHLDQIEHVELPAEVAGCEECLASG